MPGPLQSIPFRANILPQGNEILSPKIKTTTEALAALNILAPKLEKKFSISIATPDIKGYEEFFEKRIHVPDEDELSKGKKPAELIKKINDTFPLCTVSSLNRVSSEVSITQLREFITPTRMGIMLLSAYYYKKHKIEILYTESEEGLLQAIKGPMQNLEAKAWGVIVSYGDTRPHVTGLLCFRNKPSDKVDVLELDSIESSISIVKNSIDVLARNNQLEIDDHEVSKPSAHDLEKPPKMHYFRVKGARQLDPVGCRTEALTLLKDAILFFQNKDIPCMATFLSASIPYLPGPWTFSLPSYLSKTLQNTATIKTLLEKSSVPISSKSCETLDQFLTKFSIKGNVRTDKYISVLRDENGKQLEPIEEIHESRSSIHGYLNFKGKANFLKMARYIEKGHVVDPDIRRYMRYLEAYCPGKKIDLEFDR